jgi:broad specificity phosphatase PhoE
LHTPPLKQRSSGWRMTDSVKADTVKTLRLIRHAQSAANAGLSTTAPDTIPPTDLGRLQAQALADSMTSVPDLIVASSFERAIDTGADRSALP